MACLTLAPQENLSVLPIDHIFPESFTKVGSATNHFLPSYVFKFIDLLAWCGEQMEQELHKLPKAASVQETQERKKPN